MESIGSISENLLRSCFKLSQIQVAVFFVISDGIRPISKMIPYPLIICLRFVRRLWPDQFYKLKLKLKQFRDKEGGPGVGSYGLSFVRTDQGAEQVLIDYLQGNEFPFVFPSVHPTLPGQDYTLKACFVEKEKNAPEVCDPPGNIAKKHDDDDDD